MGGGPELHPFHPLSQLFLLGLFLPISPLPFFACSSLSYQGLRSARTQDPVPTPSAAQPLSAPPNPLFHPYLGSKWKESSRRCPGGGRMTLPLLGRGSALQVPPF